MLSQEELLKYRSQMQGTEKTGQNAVDEMRSKLKKYNPDVELEEAIISTQPKSESKIGGFLTGAFKGLMSTGKGISELMEKVPTSPQNIASKGLELYQKATGKEEKGLTETVIEKAEEKLGVEKGTLTTPITTPQKIGFGAEQIAEFFTPMGLEKNAYKAIDTFADAKKLSSLMGGLFKTGAKAGVEGLSSAGVTMAQTGGDVEKTKEAFLTGGLGSVIFKGLGGLGNIGGETVKWISSKMSGVPKEAIEYAIKNPDAVKSGIQNAITHGDLAPEKIYEKAVDALENLKQARREAYEKGLDKLEKETMTTKKGQLYVKKPSEVSEVPIMTPTNLSLSGVKNVFTKTLNEFGIPFKKKVIDELESTLAPEHNKKLQELGDIIYSWKNITPKGLDNLKQKIGNFELGGIELGPSAKKFNAIVSKIRNNVGSYVGEKVPQIKELTEGYAKSSEVIDTILNDLRLTSDKSKTAVTRKLMNVFNPKSDVYRPVVELLGEKGANNLMADIAGTLMSKWTPEGLGAYMGAALSLQNPINAVRALLMGSPRALGEFNIMASKMKDNPKFIQAVDGVRKAILGGAVETITGNEE